jgi:hypothetical protein
MNLLRCSKNLAPTHLALSLKKVTPVLLVDAKLRAPDTYTRKDIQDEGQKLDIIYGTCKTEVTKVSRTLVIRLTATSALLSVINDSHSWVKEATYLRLVTLVCSSIRDLYHRALFNLIGTEYTQLNANNWFDI